MAERGSKHCLPDTFLVVTDKGDCVAKVPLLPGKDQGHATLLPEEYCFIRLLEACLSVMQRACQKQTIKLALPETGKLLPGEMPLLF